ncbi:MAG TPA: hypothetical protein VGP83_08945 [Pyrinomonadaceae bacterium]|jgi:hypothetical protein|nr:hypothetical protein [Pyrinomonadaceae bacterium]
MANQGRRASLRSRLPLAFIFRAFGASTQQAKHSENSTAIVKTAQVLE